LRTALEGGERRGCRVRIQVLDLFWTEIHSMSIKAKPFIHCGKFVKDAKETLLLAKIHIYPPSLTLSVNMAP